MSSKASSDTPFTPNVYQKYRFNSMLVYRVEATRHFYVMTLIKAEPTLNVIE